MEIKKSALLFKKSENILLLPNQKDQESISCALYLFYSLKKIGKKVNLFLNEVPEYMNDFLPSIDDIVFPNRVSILIKNGLKKIKKLTYQKKDKDLLLNFFLDENSILTKNNFRFLFSYNVFDLAVFIGTSDQDNKLLEKNIEFSKSININYPKNKNNFMTVNLVSENFSLSEISQKIIEKIENKKHSNKDFLSLLSKVKNTYDSKK